MTSLHAAMENAARCLVMAGSCGAGACPCPGPRAAEGLSSTYRFSRGSARRGPDQVPSKGARVPHETASRGPIARDNSPGTQRGAPQKKKVHVQADVGVRAPAAAHSPAFQPPAASPPRPRSPTGSSTIKPRAAPAHPPARDPPAAAPPGTGPPSGDSLRHQCAHPQTASPPAAALGRGPNGLTKPRVRKAADDRVQGKRQGIARAGPPSPTAPPNPAHPTAFSSRTRSAKTCTWTSTRETRAQAQGLEHLFSRSGSLSGRKNAAVVPSCKGHRFTSWGGGVGAG